jgi:2-oxo-3-hexenedioate decarboxylase
MSLPLEIADRLDAAATERRALDVPFTDARPDLDTDTAYAVQQLLIRARLDRGARIVGAKLGLTSKAKQERMKVDQPLYGGLTSDMVLPAGERVDLSAFIHPRAEPEIAFLLGSEIAAPATITSVLAATQLIFGALEIIDSRYDNFRFRHPDVVADNASSAGVIAGSVALPPEQLGDLRLIGCVLRADGEIAATAAGAAVLGHPAESVAWLVNELDRRGQQLPAGSIVLSGALTDALPLRAGGSVSAEFDGLGMVEARA